MRTKARNVVARGVLLGSIFVLTCHLAMALGHPENAGNTGHWISANPSALTFDYSQGPVFQDSTTAAHVSRAQRARISLPSEAAVWRGALINDPRIPDRPPNRQGCTATASIDVTFNTSAILARTNCTSANAPTPIFAYSDSAVCNTRPAPQSQVATEKSHETVLHG